MGFFDRFRKRVKEVADDTDLDALTAEVVVVVLDKPAKWLAAVTASAMLNAMLLAPAFLAGKVTADTAEPLPSKKSPLIKDLVTPSFHLFKSNNLCPSANNSNLLSSFIASIN